MDCNKEEALRAKDLAEKKMGNRDFVGARKFALKAQQLHPDLENIAQMLVVCDVHCSADHKLFGNEMDWYGILQLELTAGDPMIKKQYRKFALQLHPDKNKFPGAEAAFKLIGEAQRVLLDKEKRSLYDMKRRVPTHNPAVSRFNSAARSNVRSNFTNVNAQKQQSRQSAQQQQQQSKPSVQQQSKPSVQQQQQNGGRSTFWTICPFCSVKYQYYREVLNKSLRCQHCHRPFVAYDVYMQGTSPATNSTQQASGLQKDGLSRSASKVGSGSQGYAEMSNVGPNKKKDPTDVPGKPNRKRTRKRKQVIESNESSDSICSTDSEGDILAGEDVFSGVENHSTYREEHPRRSVRQKHQASYKEDGSDNDDDFLGPSKQGLESESLCGDGESRGEAFKMNDQNGVAADLKDEHKEVKQKQHLYSEENVLNRNEETKAVGGKDAVGGSKQMDETSEHFLRDSTSKAAKHANGYVYPEAEFSDFDKDKKKECFAAGQIWAIYDTTDGMPRFYALISKVLSSGFKLQIRWFDSYPDCSNEINWVNEELPVACGKFKLGYTDITDDHLMFSHLVLCEKIGRNTFKVYPRKGEIWALFRNWDIKWYMDVACHRQYEYEFVEILSDYLEDVGLYVTYLSKLKGFTSIFFQNNKEDSKSFQIPPPALFRLSHKVPSFKMTGQEGVGVPIGSYELDPAALPMNLEEIAVPEILDLKAGNGSSGGQNTGPSVRSEPQSTSIPKINLEGGNSSEENKDSVDGSDNCNDPPSSNLDAIEFPDTQFFNFDAGRSLEKFQIGQIWAFYSDEDGLPKYYGQINKIETSPHLELHVYWLTCCWLPENTIKWEDEDMIISCGRFKVNKKVEFLSVYSTTSSVSHQIHADAVGKNYAIFPRKGEVWALYRKWSNKLKGSDLVNWEYDIVEVVEETDLFINVLVLEFVSGFSSVFRGKSNEGSSVNLRIPRKELLRFSHKIPAFKLTEEHGNLRDCWELDTGALPIHYYGLR
ncbi:hypothetical protein RJT34_32186 [Clitoria ternatea]|uniref:J domain-containing protein n=1 Tax=Clitoria ternatea TaxID=43366 RepID=A0AAN9I3I8_CLITE